MLRPLLERLPGSPLESVRRFTERPEETQERLLRGLLRRAADTEWGRRYEFEEIARVSNVREAFRERVPLHHYDDVREDVNRMRDGAKDVLWPGRFDQFAVSSGTVSEGKIIPVSQEMLDNNRDFSMTTGWSYAAECGNPKFLFGSHLTLPGRIEEDPNYPGTMVGEVSGLLAENAPSFLRHVTQAVPNEVAFLPNWEKKLAEIARRTLNQDIRAVVMAPTWGLTLFEEVIDLYNETHPDTVHTVGEIWPNLQVFISGGVALASYRRPLEKLIGLPGTDFIETYGASEGFFSFQDDLDDPSMLLHLDNGLYYEFIPMDAYREENPPRLSVGEVETDVRYALCVSSCSGLWAYDVGDVVRFTDTDPHKILVAGRTSEMIDKYGEAVLGEEAREAVRSACEKTGAHMRDFHLAPRPSGEDDLPGHQWLVEFEYPPSDEDAFTEELDRYLQEANRHYKIRKEARAFEDPELRVLPKGTFYRWLKETNENISGQTKVPRLSEERDVADGVLALSNSNP